MPNVTENYGLKKPLADEFYDVNVQNENMDVIDAQLKLLSEDSGVVISPDEPETGDVWIDTDDESGSSGGVTSVNGKTGDVNLTASDLDAYATGQVYTKTETNDLLAGKAPSGFGLGGAATLCADCNNAVGNGWYNCSGATNAPDGHPYGWVLVSSRSGSGGMIRQDYFTSTSTPAHFVRYCVTGTWGEWKTILDTVGAAPTSHNHSASNITSGTLSVSRGGTGIQANPSMLVNLAGTGAANVFQASPRPGVTGTLPVANGGTGATSMAALATALNGAGVLRYEIVSYTGTGVGGRDNPNTLTFSVVPKLVFLTATVTEIKDGNAGIFGGVATTPRPQNTGWNSWPAICSPYAMAATENYIKGGLWFYEMYMSGTKYMWGKCSSDKKTISWYLDSPTNFYHQFNGSGITYYAIALY